MTETSGHLVSGEDSRQNNWPLTPVQRAMAARSLKNPNSGFYIQQLVWRPTTLIQIDHARRAWQLIIARHDALRLSFRLDLASGPAQSVSDSTTVTIELISTGGKDPQAREMLLQEFLAADRRRGFNLASPALLRMTVLQGDHEPSIVVWTFHHVILDGRSHPYVFHDWQQAYTALTAGRTPKQSKTGPRSFSRYLEWRSTDITTRSADYWCERFRGFVAAPGLPSLVSDPGLPLESESGTEELILSEAETDKLRAGATRHGVTLNNLLQGAWALALGRYNAVEDVTFGTTRAGRHWDGANGTGEIGMFINTVPFRVNIAASQNIGDWLLDVHEQQVAVRAAEFASAAQIREWAALPPNAVLFRTVLLFEFEKSDAAALVGDSEFLEKTDGVTLAAFAGRRLRLHLEFPSCLYTNAHIRIVLAHLRTLLLGLATAPAKQSLQTIDMMAAGELTLVTHTWQGIRLPISSRPIHRLLEDRARRSPEATAVEFESQSLSYTLLHSRANQIARRLLERAAAGQMIVVILDRSIDQILVWLASFKAGLVYAPLDPGNPRERLRFLLSDIQPAVVVTQQSLVSLLPLEGWPVVCVDDPTELNARAQADLSDLSTEPALGDAAVLLYTSGSTGSPKGVVLTHKGINNFVLTARKTFNVQPCDRVLQLCPTSFDGSLIEFICALESGATLVMPKSENIATGDKLCRFLTSAEITVWVPTPTRLRSLPENDLPNLRLTLSCGEALPVSLARKWSAHRQLMNLYGPTECSLIATIEICDANESNPTLGRLLPNFRGYVLDDRQQPVPVGVPGELYLGGPSVGKHYWNRPELTAGRFIRDPFPSEPNAQVYRTGDLVRWLADGRLQYLNRLDSQIKYQGARVELGEIEAALEEHPRIRAAVVLLVEDKLKAWVETPESPPRDHELRAWLAARIQMLFIPSAFTALSELPKTRSGKVDRNALALRAVIGPTPTLDSSTPSNIVDLRAASPPIDFTLFSQDKSIVEYFREQVRRRPNAIAICHGSHSLTYSELDQRSNELAAHLTVCGLHLEDTVALVLHRSFAFAVAALGVLKAGGSYLPLDVESPLKRLALLLADSTPRSVVTTSDLRFRLGDWTGNILTVNEQGSLDGEKQNFVPRIPSDPTRRAYLIYTSGSTGKPKAVEIEHHSLTNLICHYHRRIELTEKDRASWLAPVTFDASVADLWPCLCTGGTVVIPPVDLLSNIDGTIAWLQATGITFTFVPTAFAELMFKRPWPSDMSLRFFATGGDVLHVRPPPRLPFKVLNTYGPTENTVDSTWAEVLPGTEERPAIGRPIANVFAYVLNDHGEQVPAGQEGELYLGGEQVARGYFNEPELTRARFLSDHFSCKPGARMYRTGDRVRWNREGELEFLGRRDLQIQIAGRRVELGEIESVLQSHPDIAEACCVPIREGDMVRGVAAHVVPHIRTVDLTASLRTHLQAELPAHMVPAKFIVHERLPRTTTGKVDRMVLSSGSTDMKILTANSEYLSNIDQSLTRLWHSLLPASQRSQNNETLYDLGGDSLTVVQLSLGVEEVTGRALPLSTFLRSPTLSSLCHNMQELLVQDAPDVLTFRRLGSRRPLFLLHSVAGDLSGYSELVRALGDDQPVFGLQSPALRRSEEMPTSMEEAAAEIIRRIRQFGSDPAPAFIGHSWGGLLAFEIARQWDAAGADSPFVGIIGTAAPLPPWGRRIKHFWRWFPHWLREGGASWPKWQNRFGRLREMCRRTYTTFRSESKPPIPIWAGNTLTKNYVTLGFNYRPPVDRAIQIDLFREQSSHMHSGHPLTPLLLGHLSDLGWNSWTGVPPRIHWLDGEHLTILQQPHVSELAARIRLAMDQHYRSTTHHSYGHPESRPGRGGVDGLRLHPSSENDESQSAQT